MSNRRVYRRGSIAQDALQVPGNFDRSSAVLPYLMRRLPHRLHRAYNRGMATIHEILDHICPKYPFLPAHDTSYGCRDGGEGTEGGGAGVPSEAK